MSDYQHTDKYESPALVDESPKDDEDLIFRRVPAPEHPPVTLDVRDPGLQQSKSPLHVTGPGVNEPEFSLQSLSVGAPSPKREEVNYKAGETVGVFPVLTSGLYSLAVSPLPNTGNQPPLPNTGNQPPLPNTRNQPSRYTSYNTVTIAS